MSNDHEHLSPLRADLVVGRATRSSTTDDGPTGDTHEGLTPDGGSGDLAVEPRGSFEPGSSHGAPLLRRELIESVLGELSHVLWQQRDLVTQLIYRLEVQQLMLAWGRTRWINLSTEDVEGAIQDVHDQEAVRMALVADLAPLLGTAPDASLRDLILATPDPWDTILSEHHTEFLRLSAEAEDAAKANSDLLHHQLSDVRNLLQSFGSSPEQAYGARANGATTAPSSAVLVDREA